MRFGATQSEKEAMKWLDDTGQWYKDVHGIEQPSAFDKLIATLFPGTAPMIAPPAPPEPRKTDYTMQIIVGVTTAVLASILLRRK